MKQRFLLTGAMAIALSAFLFGCNSMKHLQKEVIESAVTGSVNPTQLEALDDVVNFDYTINFEPRQLDKKTVLKITPKFQYGSNMERLQPIFLQGEKVKGSKYPVVSFTKPSSFTKKLSFKFKEGMQNGVLWADIEAIRGGKSFMMSPVVLSKNGIQVWKQHTFMLDGVKYVPVMTEDFVEDVPASEVGVVSGYVMFPLGKATISQAEQKSAVMTQAAKALEKVMADKNAKITNMFVYVSNSPEGAERLNRNLGVQRFNAAKAFFEKDLKLAGTPMVKDPSFVVSQTETENWEGLYLLLENSTIANRQQMVRELKAANAEKRSAILEAYIAKVPELKKVILPALRRADFFVFYTEPTMVEEDVELTCYAPQLNEQTPAVVAHKNWQLLNDLAVIAIQNKEYHKAEKLLEAALTLQQNETVSNNMGVVYANTGNKGKAAEMFNRAKIRKEARYNIGLVLLENDEYGKAIPYLKDMPDIHLAYAQLMNNDNRAALETFRKIKLNSAMEYYMMAVAAARTKDMKDMVYALEKAVKLQPDLKEWAATDIAFYPYKGEAVFMRIVK